MKLIFSIILAFTVVNIASCQNAGNNQSAAASQQQINQTIPVDEFENKIAALPNAQLIDVRTPEEYQGGHLRNATNMNIRQDDFEAQLGKLDKTKPVFVYCKSGGRSSLAAGKMKELGFTEVYNMDGGMMKWEGANKPVEKGNAPEPAGMSMEAFNKMVNMNKYVLVDYNAKWCTPCKVMMPMLQALANKRKDMLTLLPVDADEHKELMKQKGISSIPYLELYENGKLVWKHDGAIEEAQLLKETKL